MKLLKILHFIMTPTVVSFSLWASPLPTCPTQTTLNVHMQFEEGDKNSGKILAKLHT